MLFAQRFHRGVADGSITMTVRRWQRAQVVAGRTYRSTAGRIVVDAVEEIAESAVTDADARAAGFPDAAALRADLRGSADRPLFRIRFHPAADPDPRSVLAADTEVDVAEIDRRLARLDRASRHGPWTRTVLALIAERPATRAGDLADSLGREKQPFKLDVRKLKGLGLTESLDVGYRLSPRGAAYLRAERPRG